MNTLAFNIYIVTLLEYVAQLQQVTPGVIAKENAALRKLAPGPGNWIMPRDLEHLKQFGFPAEFRTILITAAAAKLRVKSVCRRGQPPPNPQFGWPQARRLRAGANLARQ